MANRIRRPGAPARIGGRMAVWDAGDELRARIEAYADTHGISLAEALRRLVAAGLEHADR